MHTPSSRRSHPGRPGTPPRTATGGRGGKGDPTRRRPRLLENPEPRTVTIERIVGEGRGIGFADGQTIFVPLTAPGDTVRASIVRRQGKVLHGELLDVIEPSPMRIPPRITDPDQIGGADLQHIAYADQLRVKAGIVEDSLRRIAKLEEVPAITVNPSPNEWGYRSRAEFQVDHEHKRVGYFAPNSHRVVDVAESPVLAPAVQDQLTALRDDMAAGIVPAGTKEYRAVAGDLGSVLEPTATTRSKLVQTTVGGYLFRYAAECFFQANIPVAEAMLKEVLRIAEVARSAPGIAIDLYCGVGLFTVPLAKKFPRVIGVESHQAATQYAEENLAQADQRNGRFVAAPVERWLSGDRSPLGRVALAVFDPPRTGAGQAVIEHMIRLNPAHIAAVSCDPATFARDLRGLLDGGYDVRSIEAFDMFPQTHHVEIVAHLERGAA